MKYNNRTIIIIFRLHKTNIFPFFHDIRGNISILFHSYFPKSFTIRFNDKLHPNYFVKISKLFSFSRDFAKKIGK